MSEGKKYLLLKKLLKAIGLSGQAVDDIIEWIEELLQGGDKKELVDFPYQTRDDFLSPAERSFYFVLKKSVADWADVCPKVNLGDIFYATCGSFGERQSYTNKIDRKHVDFLLCDKNTAVPLIGVELDDKSHNQTKRKERDLFVENVFKKAALPLERISVKASYNPAEINSMLMKAANVGKIGMAKDSPEKTKIQGEASPIICPKCGGNMVLRTAKSGNNIGKQFWGCTNYPRCRAVVPSE